MNYELEIAFDFKNSKEYFVRYEPIELTDSEKIPEKHHIINYQKICILAIKWLIYSQWLALEPNEC